VRDGVDPQPRRLAPADAAVEQIDFLGDFLEQRVERLVEDFEPRHLRVVQVDDDGAALGLIDARLAQRVAQPLRRLVRLGSFGGATFTTPHGRNLSSDRRKAKAPRALPPVLDRDDRATRSARRRPPARCR
jgi:hypothetical protein